MSNPVFFSLAALAAVLLIALALVYPQGLGAPSPRPFGHPLAPLKPAPAAAPPAKAPRETAPGAQPEPLPKAPR